jgi:hypothetical protein
MPREDTQFNSETAKAAGKKSKRGKSLTAALKHLFDESNKNGISPDLFVKSLVAHAMKKGNSGMAKLLWEYMEGKPKEQIEITGKNGEPIRTDNTVKIEFYEQ